LGFSQHTTQRFKKSKEPILPTLPAKQIQFILKALVELKTIITFASEY